MLNGIKFGPQNLSDAVAAEGQGSCAYYGVVLDKFCANRIKDVTRISIIADVDESGEFSFDVMDTLIQYRQAKADVILEVPFNFPLQASDVLILCNSIGAGVLLAPPAEKTAENWAAWAEQVKKYARAMFGVQAFSKEILPVTSYVQYMAMRVIGFTPKGLTDDEMMHHYFEKDMDEMTMDLLKKDLDVIIIEGSGGHEAFESLVQSTADALSDVVLNEGKERMEYLRNAINGNNTQELTDFVKALLCDLGYESEQDGIADGIAEVLIEHKDYVVIEKKLLSESAELSERELEALSAVLRVVKALIG